MGLLSDGGVHSHLDHLLALLDLCAEIKIPKVSVHAFLDGRDTPPDSGRGYLTKLLRHPTFPATTKLPTRARLSTMMGRYWAMDRDQRWDRVEKAYRTMTGQVTALPPRTEPLKILAESYGAGVTDEFVEPVLFSEDTAMRDGDSVLFFNYRADRARQLTEAITAKEFGGFLRGRGFKPSAFAAMTQYDAKLKTRFAFAPQNFANIFGQWLEQNQRTQYRIAETEKYAHVTFFFNGGREEPFIGEERLLIASPRDVATYDLRPEMSAHAVADQAAAKLTRGKSDFVLMNFANADMVGHTGNYAAAVRAMEALDQCLGKVIGAAEKSGYHVLLTADHGNAEEMQDHQGRPHTQHTLNPVPCVSIAPGSAIAPSSARTPLADGTLADLMPTLCKIMGLTLP
ncbi:MAG: 2,3-bisphosphoglycerate-independent phosphoglycerate mutase, partial [Bdellovibrionota bacterium]